LFQAATLGLAEDIAMVELRQANIVIIAKAHNPSIVSPDWIRKMLGIAEKPLNFLNTPAFSSFESDSFSLIVDQERWQLGLKKLTEGHIVECGKAASTYVRTLQHIPYTSLGMNYVWRYSPSVSEKGLPEIDVRIGELDPRTVFKEQQVLYGATIVVSFKTHMLRINMAHEDNRAIILSHNFHYDIKNQDPSETSKTIDSFLALSAKSEELTKRLMGEG